jgi:allantoinase
VTENSQCGGSQQLGGDDPYVPWSPMITRGPLEWPQGARLAVCLIVSVEHLEWFPPSHAIVAPSAVSSRGPYPRLFDITEVSVHEYGNRVGFFRVAKVLEEARVRATVAIDAASAQLNSSIVRECLVRGWEIVGHGIALSRVITEGLSESDEREMIQQTRKILTARSGCQPSGWLGPDYGESTRTPRLLAELGFKYVCDWANDDQPYSMRVANGPLVSLPVTLELDDVYAHRERGVPMAQWEEMVLGAATCLHDEGAKGGRLLVLNVHPYLIGQPFRIKYLRNVLREIAHWEDVWLATGQEICSFWLGQAGSPISPLASEAVIPVNSGTVSCEQGITE